MVKTIIIEQPEGFQLQGRYNKWLPKAKGWTMALVEDVWMEWDEAYEEGVNASDSWQEGYDEGYDDGCEAGSND